ncbi:MAG: ABC transporter permease [Dokdonella sp.]|jgi:ABC-2 type transport system permease protein|uniref:ABC transporter permease n=1 Tax=Dokdonella sp. TaxID=2291710 RepID=UPI0025BBB37F|nr:ABC transporter permease [Dokdonella sp.]MBK8123321.1 ABC transporter permease [Dokdonella sp.]HNV09227.1 ABC transporter permease [Dokdonella sp.]HPW03031.1 ABC transporter permease [Dokdonella sp.]
MSFGRMLAVFRKELRQLARDKLTFGMIVGIPTLQLLLFGFAINMDIRHLPAALMDEADTWRSRELVAELAASQVLEFTHRVSTPQDIDDLLRTGKIEAAVVIPADFENRLETGDRAVWQVLVDGADQSVQSAARQLAAFPLASLRGSTRSADVRPVEIVNFYNPERRAQINTVPGLIGVILTMTMTIFTGMAIVRERERGNMEMLIATPLSPLELTVGKVMPYVFIGLVQVSLILLLGWFVFQVPVRGALLDVYLAASIYIIATLCLGILISTLARTQFQAMQMAFFLFLPQILLSGFMFPYDGMPRVAQWIAEIFPLTHFLRLIRGVMLRGASLGELWQEMAALAVLIVVILAAAARRFRKSLD